VTAPATRSSLVDNRWRFFVDTYAEHVSRGKWKPYDWIVYVLRRVQEAVLRGDSRIIISAPPRHGKSQGICHWLPTWYLDWFPERWVLMAGHGDDFAETWGRAVRDEFYRNDRTWTRIRVDKSKAKDWLTLQGGGMKCAGIGGSITGSGGSLIIVDDPHKDWEEAMSPTHRRKVVDWFNGTLYSRLEPHASIVVVQTRWHESDLAGYLEHEHADDWEVIRLPALAEDDDLLGRAEGEALCPERFDADRLQAIKSTSPSLVWAGLYQQRPAALEGNIVRRIWFERWDELPKPLGNWLQSWDLTFSETGSSYVVGQVWATKGSDFYLVDQCRAKLSFVETIREIQMMSKRWPESAKTVLIENKANGPAVISALKDQVPGIIPVEPQGNKQTRLVAVSGLIEAGNVHIPADHIADWVGDFIEEVVTFPNARNDDQVDCLTQSISRLSRRSYNYNLSIPTEGARVSPWSGM